MKKAIAFVLVCVFCLLVFSGCFEGNISKYIEQKEDKYYLILPISEKSIYVYSDEEIALLNDIEVRLLKKAEKKITEEVEQYTQNPSFFTSIKDGKLYLTAEVIVKIDPPEILDGGVYNDHDHMFFSEPITK